MKSIKPIQLQVLMRHMESLEEEGPHVTSLPFHLRLIRPGAEVSKGLARRFVLKLVFSHEQDSSIAVRLRFIAGWEDPDR
jgi:hypothetical protein